MIIHANKDAVWNNIKSVSKIKEEELQWSFAHFIGIPRPVQSALTEEKVGGMRHIKWEKDIRFREKITNWEPRESFSYDVLIDHIPPEAIDEHVEVGGKYFNVHSGGYKLTAIDNNTTRLTLSCTYSVTTRFNLYANLWADYYHR